MKKIAIICFLLGLLMSILNSCEEASVYPYIPKDPVDGTASPYFPNEVGCWWIYKVGSPDKGLEDINMKVSIVDKKYIGQGDSLTYWEFRDANYLEQVMWSNEIHYYADSVKMRDTLWGNYYELHYVFPLEVGKTWYLNPKGYLVSDSTYEDPSVMFLAEVTKKGELTVGAGNFKDVYEINIHYPRNDLDPTFTLYATIYFVPGIGEIRIKYNPEMKDGQTWELVGYHIEK